MITYHIFQEFVHYFPTTKDPKTGQEWIQDAFLNKFLWIDFVYARRGEGNGTPVQYSCLENPMDRGAW